MSFIYTGPHQGRFFQSREFRDEAAAEDPSFDVPDGAAVFGTPCMSFINTGPGNNNTYYFKDLFTDGFFVSPDQKVVQLLEQQGEEVYTYHLTHSTGLSNADMLGVFPWYSPVNGDELLYLFDQPGVSLTEEEEVGGAPPPSLSLLSSWWRTSSLVTGRTSPPPGSRASSPWPPGDPTPPSTR